MGKDKKEPTPDEKKKPKASKALLPSEPEKRKLTIQVTLPHAALRSLDLEGKWEGKAAVRVTGPSAARMTKIAHLRDLGKTRSEHAVTPEMKQLIDGWNSRVESPPYELAARNRQFSLKKLPTCRRELDVLTSHYKENISSAWLDQYFEACVTGDYLWDGIDHRYKSLSGWVKAILKARKENARCWWEPQKVLRAARAGTRAYAREADEYPDTTKMVADAYAQLILKRTDYGEPNDDWLRFQQVADRVERIMEGKMNITREVLVKVIIRCAQRQRDEFKNRTVYPGHLTMKTLWQVALPQFLEDHLPGTALPPLDLL